MRLVSGVIASGCVLMLATVFSCKTFDLPSEVCDPTTLDAKLDPGSSDDDCSRCLEDHCCDLVGRCTSQNGCGALVHRTQRCVLDAKLKGARVEASCAANLSDIAEANDAYRCMRSSCGAQCGLPVCQVDKATLLLRNAKCDACFAGGCCAPLNSCYDNRACKLMLECIVNDCGSVLGPSLTAAGANAPNVPARTSAEIDALCAAPPPATADMPACIQNCLCRYRDNDQGLPPSDLALFPVNLAESVYTCGKQAECGDDCTPGADDAGAR